jgi:DNA uptake protein ComE-like DNA-binding protein
VAVPDWRQQIKDYLSFSSKERRGVFFLLLLLVVLLLVNLMLPWLITRRPTDFSEFERQIAAFEAQQISYQDSISNFNKTGLTESRSTGDNITPFEFDPNELSADEWKKLGLEERQIKVILNYRSKGGLFRKKQDFAKMYCISEEEYRILEPYIAIKSLSGQHEIKDVKEAELTPYPFDPNNLSKELGIKMGLHTGVINAIIAYRQKGGRFNTPSDLKKIYTLTEEDYLILEPYIRIVPDTSLSLPARKMVMVELNSADTLDLQQLHGVGPSFSKRIVRYRDLLGGFCNKEQLLEVYGMDSARYLNMVNEVMVDKEKIRKININKVTVKEMSNHPYIEYYVAKSIITYRNEKGAFTELRQIQDAKLIYPELFMKIEPYLSLK